MVTELGEFKGNKIISLVSETDDKENGKYPFSFGVKKAKLIIFDTNEEMNGIEIVSFDRFVLRKCFMYYFI